MRRWLLFELFAGAAITTTLLWLTLIVLIEGERRAPVRSAFVSALLSQVLLFLIGLLDDLYPYLGEWLRILAWIPLYVAAVGWFTVVVHHTAHAFSSARRQLLRRVLFHIGWVSGVAAVSGISITYSLALVQVGREQH